MDFPVGQSVFALSTMNQATAMDSHIPPMTSCPMLGKEGGASKTGRGWQVDSSPNFLTRMWSWVHHSFSLGLSFSLCIMGVLSPSLLATID